MTTATAPTPTETQDPIEFLDALAHHLMKSPTLRADALQELALAPTQEIVDTFNALTEMMQKAGQDIQASLVPIKERLKPQTADTAHGHKPGEYVMRLGKIVRIEKVEPTPPAPKLEFIIEERHAQVELRRNGRVLEMCGTFSDYCGEGSAVQSGIQHALLLADEQGITPGSEVELVVVEQVTQSRYLFNRQRAAQPKIYSSPHFDRKEIGACRDVAEDVNTDVWNTRVGKL